jgi:LysM repeat protein
MRTFRTRNIILIALLLAGLGLFVTSFTSHNARAQGANLLQNPGFEEGFYTFNPDDYTWLALYGSQREDCRMDDGTPLPCNTAQTPVGWIPWWISQSDEDPDWKNRMPEYKPAEPPFMERIRSGNLAAQYFTFHGTHTAGLLQVVNVPANAQVRFSIWGQAWSSASDATYSDFPSTVNMRVGIDPAGGTNPYSPSIVWSDYQQPYDAYSQFVVEAQAQGDQVTVFTISSPDEARKHNDIYWDDASLEVIGQAVAPPPPTATTAPAGSGDSGNTGNTGDSGSSGDTANPAPTAVAQAPPSNAPTATPDADGNIYYEVQEGDSFWSIAARHGLTIDEIYELNNASEGDFVQPGQRLIVGQGDPSAATPDESEGEGAEGEGEDTAAQEGEEADTEAEEDGAEAEADAEETAEPTSVPPTPTEASRDGEVCVAAYSDENQNGQRDAGEPLRPNVTFSIYNGEQVLVNYVTDGTTEPYCITLDSGNYRIARSTAPDETLTTEGEWAISVSAGSEQNFEFGSYSDSGEASDDVQVADAGSADGEADSAAEEEAQVEEGSAQQEGGMTRIIVSAAVVVAVLLLLGVLIIVLSARRSTV